jgi:hypothetical protein
MKFDFYGVLEDGKFVSLTEFQHCGKQMSDIGSGIRLGFGIFLIGIGIWIAIVIAVVAFLYWWLGPIGICI